MHARTETRRSPSSARCRCRPPPPQWGGREHQKMPVTVNKMNRKNEDHRAERVAHLDGVSFTFTGCRWPSTEFMMT